MNARVLIVVTSHARMGDTDAQTGLWVEELAVPYYRFLDTGVQVELASPLGGAAPLEPKSIKPAGDNDPVVDRFLADPVAQRRVGATRKLADVKVTDFDAIFFPGGHGTMWDLPVDSSVRNAVEAADRAGMVIAAVCHGPAGLVGAKRADGKPLVAGKRVTAFTDAEEAAVGLTTVVPFLLESRLRELGASFAAADLWQPFAVRDGRLVTGQNPASSAAVADQVMAALTEARRQAT
ncbi:MAG: type 1 glutamine amidotransferase domain-containing protein [Burkholderiales bacterium]|nr:type 1 glutamine amidotransferase domain-containing protein [Burkholderiales bacterium]